MARSAQEDADTLLAELEHARDALEEAEAAVDAAGEQAVERVADTYDRFTSLLDRYESSASGTGRETFQQYVEFEGKLSDFEDSLDEDLPRRQAFEAACDVLDRRRLDERDFERAREEVAPARELVELLDRRRRANERLGQARGALEARIRDIEDRLDDLDDSLQFADTDLDAPVADLRDPIEAYNEAVEEAFRTYRRTATAREVLDLIATTDAYPLVTFRTPPEELRTYLQRADVGTESIPTLLAYIDYSRSKLSHYVAEPAEFRGAVATNRTYLEGLDASPVRIDWPPPQGNELAFRIREYLPVVDRFADETVLHRLRTVRDLVHDTEYETLRESAHVQSTLSDAELDQLASGELAAEREQLCEEHARLVAALDDS